MKKQSTTFYLFAACISLLFVSCDKDDDFSIEDNVDFNFNRTEPLY